MKLGYGIAVLLGLSLTHVGIAACQISPTAPVAPTGEQSIQPAAQESVPAAPSHGKAAEAAAKPPPVKPTPKRHKPASTKTQPSDGPKKVVVREGGAREPAEQMAPDITPAEALRQRQNAEQWLGSADDRLKQLASRRLDAPQQETVGQIRNYVQGARSALKEGDVRRASTLAEKAHLLAEDLIGR
jgi:hypothetical protein